MQRGLAREARRRPDMDLLVGPLEAADPSNEPADASDVDPWGADAEDRPTWREDG